MLVSVPVSVGELLDKISILEVKRERITDPGKQENIGRELAMLAELTPDLAGLAAMRPLVDELAAVNHQLWDIEEGKRECERRGSFDAHFVALARSVYKVNDRRAAIKRAINELTGSALVEEKSYAAY